jgi:hypothetical protein
LKTPDAHSPDHSASLTGIEETPENMQGDPDAPEPAAEGDIQMEYVLISCTVKI